MQVSSQDSEIWWLANSDEIHAPNSITLHAVLQKFSEAFHFFGMPSKIPEGNTGYEFQQGFLDSGNGYQINVSKIIMYGSAAHITVAGSTDDAEKVFEKLVEIFTGLGMKLPVTPPVKFYRSTIVCDFEKSIDQVIAKLDAITNIIQKRVYPDGKMQLQGFGFSVDPATLPRNIAAYNPTLFRIDRRLEAEYSKNRYTCFANASTANHIAALEELEKLL